MARASVSTSSAAPRPAAACRPGSGPGCRPRPARAPGTARRRARRRRGSGRCWGAAAGPPPRPRPGTAPAASGLAMAPAMIIFERDRALQLGLPGPVDDRPCRRGPARPGSRSRGSRDRPRTGPSAGAALHVQRRRASGPDPVGLSVGVHRLVQLDLELQLAGMLREAALEFLQRRPLAPLLAEQVLGEDQVDGAFRIVAARSGRRPDRPRPAPTGPAGTAPPGRPARPLTICSGSRMPACSGSPRRGAAAPAARGSTTRRAGSAPSGPFQASRLGRQCLLLGRLSHGRPRFPRAAARHARPRGPVACGGPAACRRAGRQISAHS